MAVTLYSGEAEYEECCKSLLRQKNVDLKHVVIRNLPKREAHQSLYRIFNENREHFDFLIKLDADMVFAREDALESVLKSFSSDVDVVSYSVWDRLTQSRIWSFNAYRSSCEFGAEQNDELFTDRLPVKHSGRHLSILDPHNLILHAPNPSDFQAFVFGVHRAFKVIQPNASTPRLEASYHQLRTVRNVYRNYVSREDRKAYFAACGAELVLTRQIGEQVFHRKENFRSYFESLDFDSFIPTLLVQVNKGSLLVSLLPLLGVRRFASASVSYVWRRGFSKLGRLLSGARQSVSQMMSRQRG